MRFRSVFIWIMAALLLTVPAVAGTFDDFDLVDHTPTAPLANPAPASYAPRYVSGFGAGNAFTIFFEDRSAQQSISYVTTTTGPEGFPAAATPTNIADTHFVVKPWPITIGSTTYAYRAWASVGNNADLHFYVANDLSTWTLVSTFQIPNSSTLGDGYGFVYYGFHDVILINGTYYAFAESNTGNTLLVRSTNGDDVWEAFAWLGGISGNGSLATPSASAGWTPSGSFFDLGLDRGMGKVYVDPANTALYLAVNTAAHLALPPADFEAAFIDPANWTWNDDTTGRPTNPVLTATSEHDLRECWLVPRTSTADPWIIIYDADYGSADGGLALGYTGTIPPTPTPTPTVPTPTPTRTLPPPTPTPTVTPTRTPPPTPVEIITTSPLPAGTVGTPYSTTLQAIGGSPPYSWSVLSGSLPPGTTLGPGSGVLAGTPTQAGAFTFTIEATDSLGDTATRQFVLRVEGLPIPALGHGGQLALILVVLAAGLLLVLRRRLA